MMPDVDRRSFYLRYITNAEKDAEEYRKQRETAKKIKEELYNYVDKYKTILKSKYNIDVESYELEWGKKQYNPGEALYNKLIRYVSVIESTDPEKSILFQAIKYCNALRNEYNYTRLTELAYKRKNLSYKGYTYALNIYFMKVHKCLLEGNGYEFSHGLGVMMISRWKLGNNAVKKLDYAATKKLKQEILNRGGKLYDKLEAEWYKKRNIPYDGEDYRVFSTTDVVYDIRFYNSKICSDKYMEYKHPQYVYHTYRGMTQQQLANTCKTEEEIYNFPVDLNMKLRMLLIKYPNKYLNFVRNAEQDKYSYRPNYRKN